MGGKINEGTRVVVATVIEANGSVPRGQGTRMAIPETGPAWGTVGGGCVEKYIVREAKFVFKDGRTRVEEFNLGDDSWSGIGMSCGGTVKMMLELVEPPERLVIFGSGGISKACAQIGDLLGYKVMALDPFATKDSFPNAEVISQGVLQRIKEMTITPFDNILILTEHRYDIEALQAVLKSKARFVGMIGSRNRVNATYKELVKDGVPVDKLLTAYAPVGLDIGAVTQQEIAVSIIAEMIQVRRGGSLDHLRLTKMLEKPEATHYATAKGEVESIVAPREQAKAPRAGEGPDRAR